MLQVQIICSPLLASPETCRQRELDEESSSFSLAYGIWHRILEYVIQMEYVKGHLVLHYVASPGHRRGV